MHKSEVKKKRRVSLSLPITSSGETLMICCSSPVGWSHIITGVGFRRRWDEEQRLSGWITNAPSNYVWHHYREPAKKTNDKICSPWVSMSDNGVVAAFSHSWALNQKYTPQAAKSSIGLHNNTNRYFWLHFWLFQEPANKKKPHTRRP